MSWRRLPVGVAQTSERSRGVRRVKATLRILRRPDLAPGAARYEIDCRYSTTGLTHLPGPVALADQVLITAAGYEHESRCGECDLSDVFARGDRRMQVLTDELWPQIQGAIISRGRRN
jgi:hypothetical protein